MEFIVKIICFNEDYLDKKWFCRWQASAFFTVMHFAVLQNSSRYMQSHQPYSAWFTCDCMGGKFWFQIDSVSLRCSKKRVSGFLYLLRPRHFHRNALPGCTITICTYHNVSPCQKNSIHSELAWFWMLLDRSYQCPLWSISCSILLYRFSQSGKKHWYIHAHDSTTMMRKMSPVALISFFFIRCDLYLA